MISSQRLDAAHACAVVFPVTGAGYPNALRIWHDHRDHSCKSVNAGGVIRAYGKNNDDLPRLCRNRDMPICNGICNSAVRTCSTYPGTAGVNVKFVSLAYQRAAIVLE